MKAFWIRPGAMSIEMVECNGLADMQRMVGGYIEVAHRFPNGDIVFVDEEGLLKEPSLWFEIAGAHQTFAGNGLVTGPEDAEGKLTEPRSTRDELTQVVTFAVSFR